MSQGTRVRIGEAVAFESILHVDRKVKVKQFVNKEGERMVE